MWTCFRVGSDICLLLWLKMENGGSSVYEPAVAPGYRGNATHPIVQFHPPTFRDLCRVSVPSDAERQFWHAPPGDYSPRRGTASQHHRPVLPQGICPAGLKLIHLPDSLQNITTLLLPERERGDHDVFSLSLSRHCLRQNNSINDNVCYHRQSAHDVDQ